MASCDFQNVRSSASLLNAGIGLSELADLRGIPFPFPKTHVAELICQMAVNPSFLICTFKIVCKPALDKPVTLTPTLSQREREFSLFFPARRAGDEAVGVATQVATTVFRLDHPRLQPHPQRFRHLKNCVKPGFRAGR